MTSTQEPFGIHNDSAHEELVEKYNRRTQVGKVGWKIFKSGFGLGLDLTEGMAWHDGYLTDVIKQDALLRPILTVTTEG